MDFPAPRSCILCFDVKDEKKPRIFGHHSFSLNCHSYHPWSTHCSYHFFHATVQYSINRKTLSLYTDWRKKCYIKIQHIDHAMILSFWCWRYCWPDYIRRVQVPLAHIFIDTQLRELGTCTGPKREILAYFSWMTTPSIDRLYLCTGTHSFPTFNRPVSILFYMWHICLHIGLLSDFCHSRVLFFKHSSVPWSCTFAIRPKINGEIDLL